MPFSWPCMPFLCTLFVVNISGSQISELILCTKVKLLSSVLLFILFIVAQLNPVMVKVNVIPTTTKVVITVSWQVCTYEE